MTTETPLQTVHMFPSADSFLNHQDEIGEGSISLIPLHKSAFSGKASDMDTSVESGKNGGAIVVESWRSEDNTSWYRRWSDGWIEQGGVFAQSSSGYHAVTITFTIPYSNTKYAFVSQASWNSANGQGNWVTAKTSSTLTIQNVSLYVDCSSWYACGY